MQGPYSYFMLGMILTAYFAAGMWVESWDRAPEMQRAIKIGAAFVLVGLAAFA